MKTEREIAQEKSDYQTKLAAMSDHDLYEEAKKYIWFSAYASNNPRSAFHWMCDATYDESVRRGKDDIYSRAHKSVMRECGYSS